MSETPQRVECPTCKAGPGVPCRVVESGRTQIVFHLARWREFNAMRDREVCLSGGRKSAGYGEESEPGPKARTGFSPRDGKIDLWREPRGVRVL